MNRHDTLLRRDDTVLVVVDLQESLLKIIPENDRLIKAVRLVIGSASILEIPIIVTTQYAARLGAMPEALSELIPASAPTIDKLSFSAMAHDGFSQVLKETGRSQVLLCGIETHICITQTALDLRASGYHVNVIADAVASRTFEKHKLGMERMRDNGIHPVSSDAAVYEWLVKAGTPEFKSILPLVVAADK